MLRRKYGTLGDSAEDIRPLSWCPGPNSNPFAILVRNTFTYGALSVNCRRIDTLHSRFNGLEGFIEFGKKTEPATAKTKPNGCPA
jgi:hypothetical protein